MKLAEFVQHYTGKGIDYDGKFGFQCVDLYRQYVKEVLGFPQSPTVPAAADIWNNYLPKYFDRIENTQSGVPIPGDVLIWKKATSLPYGHVAIFLDGDASRFDSFDQNYPTGSLCHIEQHTYRNLQGWLSPRKFPMSAELDACLAAHKKLMDEITEKDKLIAALKSEHEAYRVDVENMKKAYEEDIKKLRVELDGKLALETLLQQERDGRREDQLRFDMKRIDLEGEIERLKVQLATTDDLSLRDYRVLIEALIKKVARYIQSVK